MKKEFNWRDYDDYSKWLHDVLTTLYEEKKQLKNNRDKAIDYIEEKGRLKYNPNELIDILKGDSDE